ncbi:phage tail protein [Cloacibacillus evryensis]|uniref:phage tail protein n=1 Tax=Cloacibacillus evryensis TaxID=508460 RepID=UPI000240E112|nr:phage tail protein [Cloacibacillus evryensis]EHL65465.1 hypothetical protein HMPREF1006_00478 [Synergistes sp. 3_1_syn1]
MSGLFGNNSYTETRADRINEFQLNQSSYGEFVPVVFGTTRISPNVVDWADFQSHEHKEEQSSGGKGGSKQTSVSVTYTYTVKVLLALCEGPVSQIKRLWGNTDSYDSIAALGLTLFAGTPGQTPWSGLRYYGAGEEGAAHGPHWLPYSALAYMAGEMDLGASGSLPTINVEIKGLLADGGDGTDANPADVIAYIFCDKVNGLGMDDSALDSASLARYRSFCQAADVLISTPPDTQKKKAYEIVNDILSATNSIGIWSQDRLKIIPLSDETILANGASYTPDLTPKYDLTLDDFLPDSDGTAVTFEREDDSESYNECSVEFLNRENSYEKQTVKYQVLSDVARRGLRPASTESVYLLHTKERAEYVAELKAKQSIYARNRYKFRLDWTKCLLEPGDLVAITEPSLGLDKTIVRVTQIDEDGQELEISAVGQEAGIFSASRYGGAGTTRPSLDTNVDPGSCQTPEMFVLPFQLSSREMGLAVAGTKSDWGGCMVYVSFDGSQYSLIGEKWGNDRYGSILGDITNDADEVDVQLRYSASQLQSASAASADANATLCLIGDEWITYQTSELLEKGRYKLSSLKRGLYGSSKEDHIAGERLVRVDSGIFKYAFRAEDEGRLVYIKLPAFNMFGGGVQTLDAVPAYTYHINQAAPVPPMNLTAEGWFGTIILNWEIPSDANFASAEIYCGADDDVSMAALLCQSEGNQFTHHIGSFTGRYYWIRSVGINGKKSEWSSERGVWGKSEQGSHSAMVAAILQSNPYLQDEIAWLKEDFSGQYEKLAETILLNDTTLSNHTDELKSGIAVAKQELTTKIEEDILAEAASRLLLAAAIADNTAAIAEERTSRVTQDGALSSSIDTIQTTVGENSATVQEVKESVNGMSGKWAVKISSEGHVSGIELIGSGRSSSMIIDVDNFMLGSPGAGGEYPFAMGTVDGVQRISMRNVYIQDAAIGTLKIANNAVTTYALCTGAQSPSWAGVYGENIRWYPLPTVPKLKIGEMVAGRPAMVTITVNWYSAEDYEGTSFMLAASYTNYDIPVNCADGALSDRIINEGSVIYQKNFGGADQSNMSYSEQFSWIPPADGTVYLYALWKLGNGGDYSTKWGTYIRSHSMSVLHMKR